MDHPSLPSQESAAPGQSTFPALSGDSEHVLAQLRTSIRDSNLSLEVLLDYIVHAAQLVADADGAAIAIRRDNLVVCQARSGGMAPELDTKLDADSGISGQCLRTGGTLLCHDTNNDPRVDAEVCRRLGLRSVAVVPVGRMPAVNGVLEAFSARPNAFDDSQMELLEELAELVIAAQRRSAESDIELASEKFANSEKLANAEKRANTRKRSLMLAALAVLVSLSWLFFRGKSNSQPFSAATQQPVGEPSASAVADGSSAGAFEPNPPPVEDRRSAKPSPLLPTIKASKTEKDSLTGDVTVRKFAPAPASNRNTSAKVPDGVSGPPPQTPDHVAETAPALSAVSTSIETAPGGLLSAAPNNLPQATITVSQGLSGGTIEHLVDPVYPRVALERRVEGQVLLQAVVAEDGTVRDVKVLKGDPLLTSAAIQAVSKWRYRPYRLNGQLIRRPTEITLIFKLP
jgi:TonB family protein